MQQRQLRLGDILDDYCPRERRLTNHAVVAMIGSDVKQTRCTTCDTEHEYKHAKIPRQRRKQETPAALTAQVLAAGPKRVVHETPPVEEPSSSAVASPEPERDRDAPDAESEAALAAAAESGAGGSPVPESSDVDEPADEHDAEDGPVHRPLIRATLPRPEGGHPPAARPAPDFTIRQPGRQGRFRMRHARSGQQFFGNRGNGNQAGPMRGAPSRQGGRPPIAPHPGKRHGSGRKRSK
jgi:hypothetical protein